MKTSYEYGINAKIVTRNLVLAALSLLASLVLLST